MLKFDASIFGGELPVSLAVDAEIVLDQNDGLGVREVDVGQVFQDASVIHGGMAICDLDVAPAFERSKHHEEMGLGQRSTGAGLGLHGVDRCLECVLKEKGPVRKSDRLSSLKHVDG